MNCLRCGKDANESFCPECLKTVSQPLVESPYLNTHINLNAKRVPRPAAPKIEKNDENSHSHKGYITAIVLLSILSTVLAFACLWLCRKELILWLF